MAKRKRGGGRITPKGTRSQPRGRPQHQHREPSLVDRVRRDLRQPSPLDLVSTASGLVDLCTERITDDWCGIDARPSLIETMTMMASGAVPEMQLLVRAMLPMAPSEVAATTMAVLAENPVELRHPPKWANDLNDVEIVDTAEMVETLGDGENLFIGFRWAGGAAATLVAFVDHNMGTMLKEAFVMPVSYREAMDHCGLIIDDDEQHVGPLAPADLRARLADAIDQYDRSVPPLVSDTWPALRPLTEWLMSKLPANGVSFSRPEWTDEERDELLQRFGASPHAAAIDLDIDTATDLAEPLIWFACDDGPGDPLRWSPVSTEIVLLDWYPHEVDLPEMRRLPEVLAAFVHFAHAERGIKASTTAETIASIERWTPDYLRAVGDMDDPYDENDPGER